MRAAYGADTRVRWRALPPVALMIVVLAGAILSSPTATAPADDGVSMTRPAGAMSADAVQRATDPHWSAKACQHCHKVADGKTQPVESGRIDDLCLSCHDGKKASRELHPIGRLFGGGQTILPEGWPAPGGQLGCITCHDARQACEPARGRPQDNPAFLRAYKGEDPLGFCARCHVAVARQERYNPHRMVNEDRSPREKACRFCHESAIVDSDRRRRTGRSLLRTDEITLCLSCHDRHVDYFEPGHIGAIVSPEMKAYMVAAERTGEGQLVDAQLIQEALRAGTSPTGLPLADGERVVCSTCHNPHQDGLFPPDSVLSRGAIQQDLDGQRLRLRGSGKKVCRACHNM